MMHRDEAEEASVEDLLNLLSRLARLHDEGTTDNDPNVILPEITEDMQKALANFFQRLQAHYGLLISEGQEDDEEEAVMLLEIYGDLAMFYGLSPDQ